MGTARLNIFEKKDLTCHFCKKAGHFKRNCRKLAQLEASGKPKHTANNAAEKEQVPNLTSDDEAIWWLVTLFLPLPKRIGSSTREPHGIICNNEKLFSEMNRPQKVTQETDMCWKPPPKVQYHFRCCCLTEALRGAIWKTCCLFRSSHTTCLVS